jgi:hypothetical protein
VNRQPSRARGEPLTPSTADRDAIARALGPSQDLLVSAPRFESDVFLNVPFDRKYEPLFVALVTGLVALRRRPRCVLEIPDGGGGRIARILELMQRCQASVHDLSRVTTSGPAGHRVPRFNMPFELGMACALAHVAGGHSFVVMEEVAYRSQRSLSDLAGVDPYVHRGTPGGVLAVLSDWLGSRAHDPSPRKMMRLYEIVYARAKELRADVDSVTVFTPALFRRTTLVAASVASNMGVTAGTAR